MAFLIDTIDSSGLFAQSANSATIATKDSNGNDITATYLTGVDLTPYQTTADMVNYQTTADMSAYATTGDVANKLDTSAFSDVSGTFLTAHQPISADEWNDTYETVTGNSGTWDTVSSKQPSGDYYSASNPSGFITEVPSGTLNESGFEYDSDNLISGYNGSAFAGQGGGGTSYTGDVQGALDEVYANSANYLKDTDLDIKTFEGIVSGVNAISGEQILPSALAPNTIQVSTGNGGSEFRYMPKSSPWTTADAATGIFKPLMYATGACLTMSSGPFFKGYFKGNEWFVSNTGIGQAVRGEVHATRGARIWGAEVTGGNSAEFILSARANDAGLCLSNQTTSVEFGINSIVDIQTNSATWNEASAVSSKQPSGDYYSASNPSGFISSVPDTYLQNTDLSVTDGKITGISGIPISAGGSSDISAYDLSAGNGINIVKDDANSAIGIEVTGGGGEVATSAGIVGDGTTQNPLRADETVLWSGSEYLSASPVITANDYFTNYEKINFYIRTHSTVNDIHIDSHESTTGNGTEERYDICSVGLLAGNGAGMRFNHACLTALPHTKEFHVAGVGQHTLTGTSVQTATCPSMLVKIVGINRISG